MPEVGALAEVAADHLRHVGQGRHALVMPWRRTSSRMCSMQGFPAMGTIGFGWLEVRGRRRVPSPPAMTTAFT